MQIRIWSESIVGVIHTSLIETPTSSMFARTGKGDQTKKGNLSTSDALTQVSQFPVHFHLGQLFLQASQSANLEKVVE